MGATQAKCCDRRTTLAAKWKRLTARRHCTRESPLERAKSLKYPRPDNMASMPRCSSFSAILPDDSGSSLVAPTKKSLNDPSYTLWKVAFEEQWPTVPTEWPPQQQRTPVHDMTEAIAGQLTPKGFPSHTDSTRCSAGGSPLSVANNKKPEVVYATVRRRLSLRLPKPSANRESSTVPKVEQQPVARAEQKPVARSQVTPSAAKPTVETDRQTAKKQTTISININVFRSTNKDTKLKQCAPQACASSQQNKAANRKPAAMMNCVGMVNRAVESYGKTKTTKTTTTSKPQRPAVTEANKPHFLSKLPREQAAIIEKLYLEIRAAECCGMPLQYYYL